MSFENDGNVIGRLGYLAASDEGAHQGLLDKVFRVPNRSSLTAAVSIQLRPERFSLIDKFLPRFANLVGNSA
jgi:hypothetical protein